MASTSISLWERVDLMHAQLTVLGTALYSAVTGIFRGQSGASGYGLHVGNAALRKLCNRLSAEQFQYIVPHLESHTSIGTNKLNNKKKKIHEWPYKVRLRDRPAEKGTPTRDNPSQPRCTRPLDRKQECQKCGHLLPWYITFTIFRTFVL